MSHVLPSRAAPAGAPDVDVDALIASIAIPARPALLTDVQAELVRPEPDPRRIAKWVGMDVAMTAAVLRTVNSSFYGLSRPASTVEQALAVLGMRRIATIVTGFALRQAVKGDGAKLIRFWDVSTKRSYAMARLARGLRGVDADVAQTFGLFCDVGIPLLMQRFPDYAATLKAANLSDTMSFTEVERSAHRTDHATIGALVARSWGLPRTVCDAIRLHHDYAAFQDSGVDEQVVRLIAMGLVAEVAIRRFGRRNESKEWLKAGDRAAGALVLGNAELQDWIEDLMDEFATEG
jgi:HD-like signal output (HDOD) protein